MSAVLSSFREMNLEFHRCQSTWKILSITPNNQIEALIILMLIKDVDNGGMLATFGLLYPVEPPCATASRKRPPVQNSKNFPVKALRLETLVNDHLL